MLDEDDLIRSLPFIRIRFTKQARPIQASHAPNVSRIRRDIVSLGLFFERRGGIVSITVRITASKARRAISRCLR